jgi:hypothetical protein
MLHKRRTFFKLNSKVLQDILAHPSFPCNWLEGEEYEVEFAPWLERKDHEGDVTQEREEC